MHHRHLILHIIPYSIYIRWTIVAPNIFFNRSPMRRMCAIKAFGQSILTALLFVHGWKKFWTNINGTSRSNLLFTFKTANDLLEICAKFTPTWRKCVHSFYCVQFSGSRRLPETTAFVWAAGIFEYHFQIDFVFFSPTPMEKKNTSLYWYITQIGE